MTYSTENLPFFPCYLWQQNTEPKRKSESQLLQVILWCQSNSINSHRIIQRPFLNKPGASFNVIQDSTSLLTLSISQR